MSMNMVPFTLLACVVVVVASTSVNNLLNVRSSYQSSVDMNHNGSSDDPCFDEESSVVQETMHSLGVCLRGCQELHFPSTSDDDDEKEDEYVDMVGSNATTTHNSFSSKPQSSSANLIMNTILWLLMLGSGIKLHQLFLIMSILFFTSSTLDANVVIGFVAAGLVHLLRGIWREDYDNDYDEYHGYYGDDDTASFSVELGGRKFTWQESSLSKK